MTLKDNDPSDASPSATADPSLVKRWSNRKTQAKAEESVKSADTEPASSAPLLTDADMPPLASLTEDADYSGFLSAGVSEGLRRLALRKLFHSKAFNVIDGLDDYAEDFTKFAKLGDVVTQEMRHRLAVEAKRVVQSAADNGDTVASDEDVKKAQTPSSPDLTDLTNDPDRTMQNEESET